MPGLVLDDDERCDVNLDDAVAHYTEGLLKLPVTVLGLIGGV